MLSPSQRSLRARLAAYALHAQGGTSTKAGTAAFLARFEKQVDPDSTLPPAERARRAAFARKSYMTSLTLKASRAKHMKTGATNETSAPVTTEGHGNDRPLSASYGTRASVEYLPLRHKCRLFREGRMADHLDHVAELERARAAGRVPDEYYFQALALEPTLRDGPSA